MGRKWTRVVGIFVLGWVIMAAQAEQSTDKSDTVEERNGVVQGVFIYAPKCTSYCVSVNNSSNNTVSHAPMIGSIGTVYKYTQKEADDGSKFADALFILAKEAVKYFQNQVTHTNDMRAFFTLVLAFSTNNLSWYCRRRWGISNSTDLHAACSFIYCYGNYLFFKKAYHFQN